jgi:hypothetical protein
MPNFGSMTLQHNQTTWVANDPVNQQIDFFITTYSGGAGVRGTSQAAKDIMKSYVHLRVCLSALLSSAPPPPAFPLPSPHSVALGVNGCWVEAHAAAHVVFVLTWRASRSIQLSLKRTRAEPNRMLVC